MLEFVQETESPLPSNEDVPGAAVLLEVENEVDASISILHSAINKHFAVKAELRTEEELFLLPEDIENFSLKQKAKLVKDLCEQACYELLSLHANAWTEFVASRKSDASFPLRKRDDVVRRIFRLPPAGLHLSGQEVKQLAELLIGSCRSKAVQEMELTLTKQEETTMALATQLSDLREGMSMRLEQLEMTEKTNARLKTELGTLKQQVLCLEQQLEDTLVDAFNSEEKVKSLQMDVKFLTEEVLGNTECVGKLGRVDLAGYLMSGRGEQTTTRVARASVVKGIMRVSFNLAADDGQSKSRSSTSSRLSNSSLVTIIKRKPTGDRSPVPRGPKK